MSLFDLIAAALIAVSAVVGFRNGAVKELVGLVAFGVSAFAALRLTPFTTPMASRVFHPHLLAVAVAVVVGFAAVYLALKLLGHMIHTRVHAIPALGSADRAGGLFIGAGRALLALGLFALVFDKATPAYLKPASITGAFLYPLASASGRMIGAVAPRSLRGFTADTAPTAPEARVAEREAADPPMRRALIVTATDAASTHRPKPHPSGGKGYDSHSRDQLDRLVEQTR